MTRPMSLTTVMLSPSASTRSGVAGRCVMRAPVMGGSSSMKILMPLSRRASSAIVISSLPKREGFQGPFLLCWVARAIGIDMLRTISCATGAKAYNNLSKNTTEAIAKSCNKMRELACRGSAGRACAHFRRLRALSQECQSRRCGPCRTLNIFDQTAESIPFWKTNAHRSIKNLLRSLCHAVEQGSATGQFADCTPRRSTRRRPEFPDRSASDDFWRAARRR